MDSKLTCCLADSNVDRCFSVGSREDGENAENAEKMLQKVFEVLLQLLLWEFNENAILFNHSCP